MKKHIKIYHNALGLDLYDNSQYRKSELSDTHGVDLHHIVNRENRIENIICLNRDEHLFFGEIKTKMHYLLNKHRQFLIDNNVTFDNDWFEMYLEKYSIYE